VVYGDAGNAETLRHAHVDTAEIVISTVPDELLKRTSNEAIVEPMKLAELQRASRVGERAS